MPPRTVKSKKSAAKSSPRARRVEPTASRGRAPSSSSQTTTHPWPVLTARDIMRRDVVTIDRATPLSEVEKILADGRISGAPVTDEAGQIVGVISLRDLVEHYVEDPDARPRRGKGFFHLSSEELLDEDYDSDDIPAETEDTAEDVMTAEVYRVPEDASIGEIARTMVQHKIHRVLVESGDHFAGIVGTFELLDALSRGDGGPARARGESGPRGSARRTS